MRAATAARLQGWVRTELRGMYVWRLLDACAAEGIAAADIRPLPPQGAVCTLTLPDFARLRPLARRYACRVHIRDRGGLPVRLGRFRGRYVLAAGTLLMLAVFRLLTGFIWTVEVTGNETVSAGQILRAAAAWGVRPGAPVSGVHNEELRNGVLRELDALSWITVRFQGSHALVEVRERRMPPAVADDGVPRDLYAAYPGLVTLVRVRQGTAQVEKGQMVEPGDLLVKGELRWRANPGGWPEEWAAEPVRADAEVYARVWLSARAAAPLEAYEKRPTGETRTRWTLVLGRRRWTLPGSADFCAAGCDILTQRRDLRLGASLRLPVSLIRETAAPYDRVLMPQDPEALAEALSARALAMLEAMTAGENLTVNGLRTAVVNGAVYATADGETVREITQP